MILSRFFGDNMDPVKKGNLLVILIVAVLAFGVSSAVTSVTNGDAILGMLNITSSNETPKLATVGDGDFTPTMINQVMIVTKQNTSNKSNITNKTKNNTDNNDTNDTNITDIDINITELNASDILKNVSSESSKLKSNVQNRLNDL